MHVARRATVLAALAVALAGCGAAAPPEGDPPPAQERGGMQRLPDSVLDFLYTAPGFRLADYERYHVTPLTVTAPTGALDPAHETRLRELFARVLGEELADDGPLQRVHSPGRGTLVVHPQVIDLRRIPEGFELPQERFEFTLQEGRMTLVAEIVHHDSGRVLARAADLEAPPPRFGRRSDWALIETAFRRWVRRFQERMDASEPTAYTVQVMPSAARPDTRPVR